MSCDRIEELLPAYTDGELERRGARRWSKPISGPVAACASLLAFLGEADAALASFPEVEPGRRAPGPAGRHRRPEAPVFGVRPAAETRPSAHPGRGHGPVRGCFPLSSESRPPGIRQGRRPDVPSRRRPGRKTLRPGRIASPTPSDPTPKISMSRSSRSTLWSGTRIEYLSRRHLMAEPIIIQKRPPKSPAAAGILSAFLPGDRNAVQRPVHEGDPVHPDLRRPHHHAGPRRSAVFRAAAGRLLLLPDHRQRQQRQGHQQGGRGRIRGRRSARPRPGHRHPLARRLGLLGRRPDGPRA